MDTHRIDPTSRNTTETSKKVLESLPEEVVAGQAVYTPCSLRIYDPLILGLSNSQIWRCPTRRLLAFMNEHVSSNHLDVGVGTGFFLDRCEWPEGKPKRLALLDLNEHCLATAAARIERFAPERHLANVLEPFSLPGEKFSSISLNYVLHCLPGTLSEKGTVFDHLISHLEPEGTIFGTTLLSEGVRRNLFARGLMHLYNAKGVFSNRTDSLTHLKRELNSRFRKVRFKTIGCVGFFACWKYK